MARTTIIIDALQTKALGASAKVDRLTSIDSVLEVRIGNETIRIVVPADQAHGIAAAIASDLLACLPVVGGA
jgi:hypothetical protein